jgi:DNA-binding LacI/PurR family transcriptional regulator
MALYFERALNDSRMTAWVAAEDGTAAAAAAYLAQKGVRVPQEISLIGFDNNLALVFQKRLTSYDFDFSGIAHRALSLVLRPQKTLTRDDPQIAEVNGVIIERGSTTIAGRRSPVAPRA